MNIRVTNNAIDSVASGVDMLRDSASVDECRHLCDQLNAGLPPLENDTGPAVSAFEFWPAWIFYTPVVLQSLLLGIRHRNLMLPLIANPGIELSGMVGESKHQVLALAGDYAKRWIAPYIRWQRTETDVPSQVTQAFAALSQARLSFPLVAKPDIGCRGAGVRLLECEQDLHDYIAGFPLDQYMILQQKAEYQAEAGVFYVRYPGASKGEIISLTLKYTPFVEGDGKRTLKELIAADKRAGQVSHLYTSKHQDYLNYVVPRGRLYRLSFSGSHCRGSVFRNGNRFITEALTQRFDCIFDDLPGIHYGRLDVKFSTIEALMAGEDFTVLEINGASSEAAHIWDRNTRVVDIFLTLLYQYRILFRIGAMQRARGFKAPSIIKLLRAWKKEKKLAATYPATD